MASRPERQHGPAELAARPQHAGRPSELDAGKHRRPGHDVMRLQRAHRLRAAQVRRSRGLSLRRRRSMVHYHGTPDPGQRGNVVIAFHREPDYQHIDQLRPGDTVTIQDRQCQSFAYKITGRWDLPPAQVTQLAPTTGYDLTLVTCDPWWQDYNRLVWRATLVNPPPDGAAQAAAGAPGAIPTFSH
ncbi:MAG: class E sortase [Chloroflexi bacterium]|nr:MAG: class E sortase [Chloroflexota bacterium]